MTLTDSSYAMMVCQVVVHMYGITLLRSLCCHVSSCCLLKGEIRSAGFDETDRPFNALTLQKYARKQLQIWFKVPYLICNTCCEPEDGACGMSDSVVSGSESGSSLEEVTGRSQCWATARCQCHLVLTTGHSRLRGRWVRLCASLHTSVRQLLSLPRL